MTILIRQFATIQEYNATFGQMREFTKARSSETPDEIWFLEHLPVFTQGLAGKAEHVLAPGDIPIVQSDRGGQVTYHGPNQLMIYTLFDLKRLKIGIKAFVSHLENSIIHLMSGYGVTAHTVCGAPGVYVDNAKICSLGLRVTKGCTYHGLCLNVNLDLEPFSRINPCGFKQLKMTRISDFVPDITLQQVIADLTPILMKDHFFHSPLVTCGVEYDHQES